MQNLELVNPKCVTYAKPIPLSLREEFYLVQLVHSIMMVPQGLEEFHKITVCLVINCKCVYINPGISNAYEQMRAMGFATAF